jgi:expansin (peptidoglycan-binding protein)
MTIADSCPCSANSKWCCGSGRDHCGEVKDTFKYGCQLPPSPPDPPPDHDPLPNESVHFDLDDVAMARLQTGDPNGVITDGVIPTKYKRVPCPVAGNIHIWLLPNGNEYYFALTVVNVAGLGAAAQVEAQLPSGDWVALMRNQNYSLSRPQERYGTWTLPQVKDPFQLPVTLRITDGGGRTVVAKDAIKAWAPTDSSLAQNWFIDIGVQF